MRIGHVLNVIAAAGVEQVKDRESGLAGGIHAAQSVPERAACDGGYAESGGMRLAVKLVQAIDGELSELFGINFGAAVLGSPNAIRYLDAVAVHPASPGVEEECPDRGAADVEANDEGIGGAHGEFPL
jgi:hypothetical protein